MERAADAPALPPPEAGLKRFDFPLRPCRSFRRMFRCRSGCARMPSRRTFGRVTPVAHCRPIFPQSYSFKIMFKSTIAFSILFSAAASYCRRSEHPAHPDGPGWHDSHQCLAAGCQYCRPARIRNSRHPAIVRVEARRHAGSCSHPGIRHLTPPRVPDFSTAALDC